MLEVIKNNINEVLAIAEKCPEKYQLKCFEILLDALVRSETKVPLNLPITASPIIKEDVKPTDGFFTQCGISEDQWKRVFNHDGTQYIIIINVNSLKEKVNSKKQVKLALLLGIKNLFETGAADIQKDMLVDTCKNYACHDPKNFSTNMKKQRNLFLPKGDGWTLTMPGREKAAEIIKELGE